MKSKRKDKGGRPTKFERRFCDLANKFFLYRPEGTDKELAEYLNVAESTVHLWKKEHARFSESIREGKLPATVAVNHSLFKLAMGGTRQVGKVADGEVVMVTEEVPPDLGAIRLFMMNRDKTFRDRNDVVLSNPDGTGIGPSVAQIQQAQMVAEMLFERSEAERLKLEKEKRAASECGNDKISDPALRTQ